MKAKGRKVAALRSNSDSKKSVLAAKRKSKAARKRKAA
jgi:hypothetical protein